MSTGNCSQRMLTDILLGAVVVVDKRRHVIRRAKLVEDIVILNHERVRTSRGGIKGAAQLGGRIDPDERTRDKAILAG